MNTRTDPDCLSRPMHNAPELEEAARVDASNGALTPVRVLGALDLDALQPRPVTFFRRRHDQVSIKRHDLSLPTHFDQLQLCSIQYGAENEAASGLNSLAMWRRAMTVRARLFAQAAQHFPPLHLSSPFIDYRRLTPNNISHVLHELVPLTLRARQILGQDVNILTYRMAAPFRALIEGMGLTVVDTPCRVVGQALAWHGCRPYTAYEWPWFDMPAIVFDPHAYRGMSFPCKAESDSIFVSRRGARSLKNATEVDRLLASHGYQTIYLEDYSGVEKLGILSQARRIVAVSGAGLAAASFNARGLDSIIELMPPHSVMYWFLHALSPLTKQYGIVLSEYDVNQTRLGWPFLAKHKDSAFAVDLELLEAALAGSNAPSGPPVL